MFKSKDKYILATPSAISNRLRRKRIIHVFSLVFIGIAIALIARQWQPGESRQDGLQLDSSIASNQNSSPAQTTSKDPADSNRSGPLTSINKAFLRDAISSYVRIGEFPSQLGLNNQILYFNYTLDQNLQDWAETRLARYNPDYGVFVALDPDNGKILALATSRRDATESGDLALRATYPAASTFKLITAAAALEEGVAQPETVFAFNGKSTSLYKKQVFDVKENKWTRRMSFKTAFAKSVNPIFGRLGAKNLGAETLLDYAERFGFNARFVSDFEFDNGSIEIDPSDQWQAAESASGYTRRNTLNPIHGAALAASIANGGKLISPRIVESVTDARNQVLYSADEPQTLQVLSEQTANSMRKLMQATITEGTARRSFRSFSRQKFSDVVAGGKSGHLSGFAPKGTYDWFIGYGERDSRNIAYAMLCINKEKWYVKSARFAREALEHFFGQETPKIAEQTQPINPAETS